MDTADGDLWWWATRRDEDGISGDRFVIALGKAELWPRVRAEIAANERCSWLSFGEPGGRATLADCMCVHLIGREVYGANLDRVVIELARVPAYAEFVRDSPMPLAEHVSNPIGLGALSRTRFDREAMERLGRRVSTTLGLTSDDWWR